MSNAQGRYDGKPFLRLIECYVLHAIGQLSVEDSGMLKGLEPKLEQTYGMKGSWVEIVQAQMAFPDTLPGQLKMLWRENVDAADARGATVDPNAFAVAIIDRHFPHAV